MIRPSWFAAFAGILLPLGTCPPPVHGASTTLVFAGGRITCEIVSLQESLPEPVGTTLPMAMNAAVEHVGPPDAPARLTLRLLEPPSFFQRFKAMFRPEVAAIQQQDEIALQAGNDPLKLAFRLGHEVAHWLTYRKNPVRPPLWLDEGLAQLVGAAAAGTCARTLKQALERPPPARLDDNLYALEELAGLTEYSENPHRSAAFYWQAEALVRAIRQKLGPGEFATYLGLLSAPGAPPWDAPLRERWYFSDWDMDWLAQQIRPDQELRDVP